jgi:hypothetical protein
VVNYPPQALPDAVVRSAGLIPQGFAVSDEDVYVLNTLRWPMFEWDMANWSNRLRRVPLVSGLPLPVELAASIDLDPILPTLPVFDAWPSEARGDPKPGGPISIPTAPVIHSPTNVAVNRAGGTSHAGDTFNGGIPAADGDDSGSQDPAAVLTPALSIVSVPQPPSFMLLVFSGMGLLWRRRHSVHRLAR